MGKKLGKEVGKRGQVRRFDENNKSCDVVTITLPWIRQGNPLYRAFRLVVRSSFFLQAQTVIA